MKILAISLMIFAILLLGGGVALADSPNDILIIANNDVKEKSISLEDVRAIFLKHRTTWSSGKRAIPVNVKKGMPLRNAFRERVLGMSAAEEETYWKERMMQTGDTEPVEFASSLKSVFKLSGSISYVLRAEYIDGVVKVLLVVPAK